MARLGSHRPGGPLRGGKYSNFEAGTRVPFIVRWPGRVKAGLSDALVSQVDFPASFASFARQTLGEADAPDSFDVMRSLLGEEKNGREQLVEQASALSLRAGAWKYIEPSQGQRMNKNNGIETGNDPDAQLYHLATDPGERTNVAAAHPDRVKDMAARLGQIRESGRSRAAVAR